MPKNPLSILKKLNPIHLGKAVYEVWDDLDEEQKAAILKAAAKGAKKYAEKGK